MGEKAHTFLTPKLISDTDVANAWVLLKKCVRVSTSLLLPVADMCFLGIYVAL